MLGLQGFVLIIASGLASALLTGLAITACRRFGIVADRPHGVQSVHRHWAPRVGGAPIFLTMALGVLVWTDMPERSLALMLLVCALPAFVAGFIEDLWDRVGPNARLLATFLSAWLAWFLLDGRLVRVDIPGLDWLLQNVGVFGFLFTAFAVGGVAHSINIIDGFNGLSTFFCVICFAALFIVATVVGDPLVQGLSLLFAGTLLGFLAWNFPFGRVFLGDAGAYFLGFALGEICVLLVARNPQVSPWFCFLLMAYPIWDTLFSSYRREIKRRVSWSSPDALHLHHLIYRRLVRPFSLDGDTDLVVPNSLTSLYVWALGLMCAVPAVLFWDSTAGCVSFAVLFGVSYGLLYRRLAKFRAPRLLQLPMRRPGRGNAAPIDDTLSAK
ncbi:MAG: glycosyltransferase family 4 protein [Panacagrimonas sp.]